MDAEVVAVAEHATAESLLDPIRLTYDHPDVFMSSVSWNFESFSENDKIEIFALEQYLEQAAIEDISDSDGSPLIMKQKFDPWLYQSGYPIIHVSWDPIIKTIHLTQSHFNPDLFQGYPASEFNYKWNIPITIGDRSNSALLHSGADTRMDRQDISIKDENLAGDWTMINIGAHTLCRVNYDQETFGHIADQLKVEHNIPGVKADPPIIFLAALSVCWIPIWNRHHISVRKLLQCTELVVTCRYQAFADTEILVRNSVFNLTYLYIEPWEGEEKNIIQHYFGQ
ncbi:hypothetical protein CAPTEDRAFT_194073 [Capitella teleta]|uniref:Uncharacterized protein n=1 Tax=Capitella teleta TaxID=283909 RepID=R7V9U5_CAPTE|nr:hypothetical protein CAPTEDRAFT_194073 [Capitella teleta]|eukprot:ELU13111.1 hypothetical protein CAPTEDRAFT_194073 [Capitella teleta]